MNKSCVGLGLSLAGWAAASLRFLPTIQRKPVVQAKPKHTPRVVPTSLSASASGQTEHKATAQPSPASTTIATSQNLTTSLESANDSKSTWNNQRPVRAGADKLSKKPGKGQKRPAPMSLEDDYDPTRPNDYDDYKEHEKRRRESELHQLQEEYKRRRSETPDRERRSPARYKPPSSVHSSPSRTSDAMDESSSTRPPPAHIDLDITGEEAYLRRARLTNVSASTEPSNKIRSPTPNMTGQGSGEDFAHRMLTKYGWQEGQGLGKSEQGISEPLTVQKTDVRSAVIVNNASVKAEQRPVVPKPNVDNTISQASAPQEILSRVILLTNMVGPGEVDDTLQEETADECNEKYGTVERCLIFEVPNGKLPDDEAVRIFVKFVGQEAAMRAKQDLNGRFFGGRAVTARFFDEARFDKLDLAPSPTELQRDREPHGS